MTGIFTREAGPSIIRTGARHNKTQKVAGVFSAGKAG
jgi:hypothetical protein